MCIYIYMYIHIYIYAKDALLAVNHFESQPYDILFANRKTSLKEKNNGLNGNGISLWRNAAPWMVEGLHPLSGKCCCLSCI